MNRLSITFLAVAGCALLLGSTVSALRSLADDVNQSQLFAPPIKKPTEVVKKIIEVKLMHDKDTKSIQMTVVGQVPTAGFSQPAITMVTYIKAPDDGIQDFYLMAVAPEGPAAQVISQVVVTHKLASVPEWLRGVRVHGVGDGVKQVMLLP